MRRLDIYINRIVKTTLSTKLKISVNAKEQLSCCLFYIIRHICTLCKEIRNKKILCDDDVDNACKFILTPFLYYESKKKARMSIELYNTSNRVLSRQNRSNLILPPSIIENVLRESFSKLSKTAPIYLTAILEYICLDILYSGEKYALQKLHKKITVQDLELGIKGDKDLETLINSCKVYFTGGTVISFIHEDLLKKKMKRQGESDDLKESFIKKRRYRQGVVAIRDIKRLQKTSNMLILPKLYIRKKIRSSLREIGDYKVSNKFFIVFQYYLESYMLKIFQNANLCAIHANRNKILVKDIDFYLNLT